MFFAIDALSESSWRTIGIIRQFTIHDALESVPSLLKHTDYAHHETRVRSIGYSEAVKFAKEFVEFNPKCPHCATKTKLVVFHGAMFYVCDLCERIWPKQL